MNLHIFLEDSRVSSVKTWGVRKKPARPVQISTEMLDQLQEIARVEGVKGPRYLIEPMMQKFIDGYNRLKKDENEH